MAAFVSLKHIFILQNTLHVVANVYTLPLSPFLPCQLHQTVQEIHNISKIYYVSSCQAKPLFTGIDV